MQQDQNPQEQQPQADAPPQWFQQYTQQLGGVLQQQNQQIARLAQTVAQGSQPAPVRLRRFLSFGRHGKRQRSCSRPSVFLLLRSGLEEPSAQSRGDQGAGKLGDDVHVTEGLDAGETVVLDPPAELKDGAKVVLAEDTE